MSGFIEVICRDDLDDEVQTFINVDKIRTIMKDQTSSNCTCIIKYIDDETDIVVTPYKEVIDLIKAAQYI